VPALTGTIMTMGVATANSILLVSFARSRLAEGVPPVSAALEAASTRLRPVLMTAFAMIAGMLPMALGRRRRRAERPLGRAVIGGLAFATASTLLFVPSSSPQCTCGWSAAASASTWPSPDRTRNTRHVRPPAPRSPPTPAAGPCATPASPASA
jgi:predicted RND superfamily exporter protein